MNDEKENKTDKDSLSLITLTEASKITGYTPEHLNLLCRKGILTAKKVSRNWLTTREWLDDFISSAGARKDTKINAGAVKKIDLVKSDDFYFEHIESGVKDIRHQGTGWAGKFIFQATIALSSSVLTFVAFFAGVSLLGNISSTDKSGSTDIGGEKYRGTVKGEEDIKEEGIKQGVVLASENYRIRGINLGGDVTILSDTGEGNPLEIYNIQSEALKTKDDENIKIVIRWKTNKLAASTIDYFKINGQNSKSITEKNYGFDHSIILSDLDYSTTYVFEIKVRDRWGNEITSGRYSIYSGSRSAQVVKLIEEEIKKIFSWAIKE